LLGTGRCGSTLVSGLLRTHPHILSLSELFGLLGPEARATATVSGRRMWEILSRPRRRESLMLREDIGIPEYLYRLDGKSRFDSTTGVPPILLVALPHLTDEYYALYEDMRKFVEQQPELPLPIHFQSLFSWLTARLDKRVCVERSGGSLAFVQELLEMFPAAPRIHLVRDGRDCALSMAKHHGFRLMVIGNRLARYLGADPYYCAVDEDAHRIPEPLAGLLPHTFDRATYLRYEIPVEEFGGLWSDLIVGGLAAARQDTGAAGWHTLTFEQLSSAPEATLRALCSAIGAGPDQGGWARRAAAAVLPGRGGAWRHLDARARRRLHRSCEPGFAALAAIGVSYG
jgi:putative sulfotransferase